eukprot:167497-Pyramimonas_sp.AAC.1
MGSLQTSRPPWQHNPLGKACGLPGPGQHPFIVAGPPCNNLSAAGTHAGRDGLAGTQSSHFLSLIHISEPTRPEPI